MQALRVRSMTNGATIMASAEIGAPPERVFGALVGKEVEQWWGSADTYRKDGRLLADLRVGGRWTVVVRTAGGRDLPASGEFLEIETPRRSCRRGHMAGTIPRLAGAKPGSPGCWSLSPTARASPSAMPALAGCERRRLNMPRAGHECWPGCKLISRLESWPRPDRRVERRHAPSARLDPRLFWSTSHAWENRHVS